jgi:hypothetical protein
MNAGLPAFSAALSTASSFLYSLSYSAAVAVPLNRAVFPRLHIALSVYLEIPAQGNERHFLCPPSKVNTRILDSSRQLADYIHRTKVTGAPLFYYSTRPKPV